nr:unnamed protein product [Callosobruchus chinensis]
MMNMLQEMKKQNEEQAEKMCHEMKQQAAETRTSLEQTVANMQGTVAPSRRGSRKHKAVPSRGSRRVEEWAGAVHTEPEGNEKFTCWRCGQKGHLRVGCRIQVNEIEVNVEKSAKYTSKMKSTQDKINSIKEEFDRDIKNLLKKNEKVSPRFNNNTRQP